LLRWIKSSAGDVSLKTMLDEVAKLEAIRAFDLRHREDRVQPRVGQGPPHPAERANKPELRSALANLTNYLDQSWSARMRTPPYSPILQITTRRAAVQSTD